MSTKKCGLCILLVALIALTGCSGEGKSGTINESSKDAIDALSQKETQYYSNGRRLYSMYCNSCHMDDGKGLGRLIPPLAKADYLVANRGILPRVLKYGLHGPVLVNGVEYNQPMPANPKLTNLEIAEILTYIGNTWGNSMDSFTLQEVKESLTESEN